jgi:uncharacterized protein (UPF0335 family)
MSKPDTSREAVVRLRKLVAMCGEDADIGTLRALLAERDEARQHVESERDIVHMLMLQRAALEAERDAARAQLTDVLAENDALRFSVNNVRAIIEAAYQAGAEAMREQAVTACRRRLNARTYGSHENACEFCAAAIRALPLPKMEDTND